MDPIEINIIVGSVIFFVLSSFIFWLLLYLNRRALQHQQEMSELQANRQRELLDATFEVQENERKRIGSDIHDDIGPLLSTLKLSMARFRNCEEPSETDQLIRTINGRVDEVIQLVRSVARDLRPAVLEDFGLIMALEDAVQRMNQTSDLKASLQVTGRETELPPKYDLAIYRIILELSNNALKHSGGNQLNLLLAFTEEELEVAVQDNGQGFSIKNDEIPAGIGLKNIQARASLLDTQVIFDSAPRAGTKAHFRVPLPLDKPVPV